MVDNEEEKIDEWSPCLATPKYGVNITHTISLTAPSTGNEYKTEYTLTCISVQYFDQADNGTLGSFYGSENRADIKVIVTEENDNGHNITVTSEILNRAVEYSKTIIIHINISFYFQNISLPWLIILIVVCCLLLLFILLLLWTYCTKTLCFASKDHNNNNVVRGSQGRNVKNNKNKSNQKSSEGIQGRDIHLVQNNDGKHQRNRNDSKFQELRVINQYDNHLQQPSRGRDSYMNDESGYGGNRHDYKNYNQHPSQVDR